MTKLTYLLAFSSKQNRFVYKAFRNGVLCLMKKSLFQIQTVVESYRSSSFHFFSKSVHNSLLQNTPQEFYSREEKILRRSVITSCRERIELN